MQFIAIINSEQRIVGWKRALRRRGSWRYHKEVPWMAHGIAYKNETTASLVKKETKAVQLLIRAALLFVANLSVSIDVYFL